MTVIIDGSASAEFETPLPVAEGGTGATASTGSGNVVLSASPTFTGTVGAAALNTTGLVGIGTGSPVSTLDVVGAGDLAKFTQTAAGGYSITANAYLNGGTYYLQNFMKQGVGISNITSNGTTISYNTGSDYRLKDNIQPLTLGLATVAKLKPSKWNWKEFWGEGGSQGFVAHELQAVVPECVTGKKDAVDAEGKPIYQGVDTSFLVATLTTAIQEQQAIIETLTTRIEALEAK